MADYPNINVRSNLRLNEQGQEFSILSPSIEFYYETFLYGDYSLSLDHWHPSFQINFITRGTLLITIGSTVVTVEKGDGILINSGIIHRLEAKGSENCTTLSMQFPPSAIFSEADVANYQKYVASVVNHASFKYLHLTRRSDIGQKMLALFDESVRLIIARHSYYDLELKIIAIRMWMLVIDHLFSSQGFSHEQNTADPKGDRIKTMISFIHGHYYERVTLQKIAASANISVSECSRCFQKYFQTSPINYLISYRIKYSCQRLKGSTDSVEEIAWSAGFSQLPYFYRTFKQQTGYTPKEYRQIFSRDNTEAVLSEAGK